MTSVGIRSTRGPAVEPQSVDLATDAELLRWWATGGGPAALEPLVRRHGAMVLGVCRRMLGDSPDADDAFQATFLVLVRKAKSLDRPEQVAGYLPGASRSGRDNVSFGRFAIARAVTRVNPEQASKVTMWTPTRLNYGEGWHPLRKPPTRARGGVHRGNGNGT